MNNTQKPGRLAFRFACLGLVFGAAIHLFAYWAGPNWMTWLGAPPSIVMARAAGGFPALAGTLLIASGLTVLALLCWIPVRGAAHRLALWALALLFLARGLLILPYWAGLRALHTPLGHFVIRGDSFAAGSLIVFAIGALVAGGLLGTRSQSVTSWRADP